MIYVVGSGPAGVSCASALLSRGARVTMLDAGVELEPEIQQAVARLSSHAPGEWDAAALERIKRPTEVRDRAVPLKAAYGSLFPYVHAPRRLRFETHGVDASPSFARGGLSNVWGATVLPYHPRDLAGWPFGLDELAPHYAAAARLMGASGTTDRLAAQFPLFIDGSSFLRPSPQAEALMSDLERNAEALEAAGWSFGYARLAVEAGTNDAGQACVYCGLCLYGCPYGLIYNAASTLGRLRDHDHFTYRPEVVVTRVVESAGGVRIHGESRTSGERISFDGDRVYLAAGTYNTTAILLASLDAYETPVRILDSQIFLLPTLRYRGVPEVSRQPLHTLTQIFVELLQPALSPRTFHLQVYTYNDWYIDAVKRRLGVLHHLVQPWLNTVLGRLVVFQGYLPSELSPEITATLRAGDAANTLVLEARENTAARPAIDEVVAVLGRHRRQMRAIPLVPLLEISAPGRGYHTGGSFPMRASPAPFESDRWGRPYGFERVHAVDATVFPSIPAGPITFTVVANAHRIATEWATA